MVEYTLKSYNQKQYRIPSILTDRFDDIKSSMWNCVVNFEKTDNYNWMEKLGELETLFKTAFDRYRTSQVFGRLRKDDDGHWYLISENDTEDFSRLLEMSYEDEDAEDEFIERFNSERIDGYSDLQILLLP